MTPKEKAKELISKYLIHFVEFYNDKEYDYNTNKAKQCAFILVDEIILISNYIEIYYWKQVKQEIEKL